MFWDGFCPCDYGEHDFTNPKERSIIYRDYSCKPVVTVTDRYNELSLAAQVLSDTAKKRDNDR